VKLNWIHKIIFIANIFVAIALVLASFSSSVEPESNKWIYIIGLTYPLWLLLNIVFILYWLYKVKPYLLLSVIALLVGYNNLFSLVTFNTKKETIQQADFSIMSFNVRLFNQYHWLEEEGVDQQILDYIQEKQPDVVALQEFINIEKDNLLYIKKLKALGYPYYKREDRASTSHFFGLITFSKYKITNSGSAYQYGAKGGKTVSFFTDIKINKQIVRVYNTHLNSLRFLNEDYLFVENITAQNENEALQKSKNILTKVMVAARKRQREVDEITTHMAKCPFPLIVLGDFNEPPFSYSYPKFRETLNDPFLKYGFGVGTTFDGISTIPGLRLDFILHSPNLNAEGFETGPSHLSDHRPLMAWFALPK
tara:strand:- start:4003 stop:5100 length:1098 start_codon:yes stop_codon:yes gene_type:complete